MKKLVIKEFDAYSQMPARVLQSQEDMRDIDYTDYYEIYWDGPNTNFGSFRVSRLTGNVAQGKRQVINILKAAYQGLSLKSFEDALEFCKHMGMQVLHVENGKYEHLV